MPDELEAALSRALAIVRGADLDPDKPAGTAALTILLERELAGLDHGPREHGSAGAPTRDESPDAGSPVVKIAAWARLDQMQVADLVEFCDDEARPIISAARLPTSKARQQRVLGLLKLALDRVGYGHEEVETRRIYRLCEAYGIADQNIPHNLVSRNNLINRRGQRGAQTYRITIQGLDVARTTLLELVNGTDRLQI
jgi:hypothetical protein